MQQNTPVYKPESHFRGDPSDVTGPRCQFRRYMVDIYLQDSPALQGAFKLKNTSGFLYYLGYIAPEDVEVNVTADVTETRNNGVEVFITDAIQVVWRAQSQTSENRRKIVRLMLCFNRWGMGYDVIEKHQPDKVFAPYPGFENTADGVPAQIAPNVYLGVVPENPNEGMENLPDEQLPADKGNLLSRFAMLADAHVGRREKWPNYDWLYGVFDHLEALHAQKPFDFVLQLGDNIDDGYKSSYKADYDVYLEVIKRFGLCDPVHPLEGRQPGKLPHYELQGNHDPSPDTRFLRQKLWYTQSKDGQKVAYIAFFTHYGGYPLIKYEVCGSYDSYRSYGIISDESVEFVKNAILEAKDNGAVHIVLCSHFGISQDLGAPVLPETGLERIYSLCKKYGIKLYLNGHEHNPDFTLWRYGALYESDAARLSHKYAVVEIYRHMAQITVYNTNDHQIYRIDRIPL